MPPDATLPERVRDLLSRAVHVEAKRMFGGTCFLADGEIVATVRHDGDLMVRVDPTQGESLRGEPGAGPAGMGARVMGPAWVQVAAAAVEDADRLGFWLDLAVDHHRSRAGGPLGARRPPRPDRAGLESGLSHDHRAEEA